MTSSSTDRSLPVVDVCFRESTYPVAVPDHETDYIQGTLMRSGEPYELSMLDAMSDLLELGDMVIDVGANVGNHTLFLAHVIGCRVAAFEPSGRLTAALEESLRLGDVTDRVRLAQVAVGSSAGRGRLVNVDETNLGGQAIALDVEGDIEVVTLDSQSFDEPVRAIKIDVEGMDLDVLDGAVELIARDRPLLFVESMDVASFEQVLAWTREHGYWLGETFNATPTHLYRPSAPDNATTDAALVRAARTRYEFGERSQANRNRWKAERQDHAAAREELADVRSELAQAHDDLQQHALDLRSMHAALKRVQGEALVYRRERDDLSTQLNELSSRYQQSRSDLQRNVAGQSRQLKHEAARHAEELAKVRRRLQRVRRALADLEGSKPVRVADVLRNARRSPRAMLRAPRDVVRLLRSAQTEPLAVQPAKAVPALPTSTNTAIAAPKSAQAVAPTTGPARYEAISWAGGARMFDAENLRVRSDGAMQSGETLKRRMKGENRPVRVAAITDEFTRNGLAAECDWLDLHPDTWKDEVARFDADLLFVESAWRGHQGSWHNSVPKLTRELHEILEFCRLEEIPTLFWNKEDPVHFDTFLAAAAEFDHVYTTDIDCIPRYRAALGHDRVHFMPFACQPRTHNPIEPRPRKEGLAFAGGYYTRYQERMRDLEALVLGTSEVMPVHIYDRMFGTTLDEYRFPDTYQPYVVGTLEPADLDVAYKGYEFALNLNSVKHSQSMFARRAYELLASGTVTVSNYSHGIRSMLGDLIPMGDSSRWVQQTLTDLTEDRTAYDRLRLMGLRKVHTEHTYASRLRYLIDSSTASEFELDEPCVRVLIPVSDRADTERASAIVARQVGVRVVPTLVTDDPDARAGAWESGLDVMSHEQLSVAETTGRVGECVGLAVMHPDDWHGPTYLLDLCLGLTYAGCSVVGRAAHARVAPEGTLEFPQPGLAYTACEGLEPRESLIAAAACVDIDPGDLLRGGPAALGEHTQFTIDRFDYCRDGARIDVADLSSLVGSTDDVGTGHRLADIYRFLNQANVKPAQRDRQMLSAAALLDHMPIQAPVQVELREHAVVYTSELEPDAHAYLWTRRRIPVREVSAGEDLRLSLQYDGDASLMLAVRFYDQAGGTLTSAVKPASKNVTVPVPDRADKVAFAVRVLGTGVSKVHEFSLDHLEVDPPILPARSDLLVVTDHYPSNDDLYRNGFVHSRVRSYLENGLGVDVFRLRAGDHLSYHKFEDVEVATGSAHALRETILNGRYRHVLVHFLNPAMWEVLREFQDRVRITVWVHGAEVQPWWRREFNFQTDEQLEQAKPASDDRLAFWRDVIDHLASTTHFVFVSRYFADEVMEDLQRSIPAAQVHIIHNPVDTTIFDHVEKPESQRTRILSIRPFASAKYANDLSVAAVLDLAQEPWFADLEFCFVGDGPLFDETLAPLRALSNVRIHRGFLPQGEIAALHKEFGVFLVPTRMDAQGVSKDEAMSSGLVPVTTGTTAIPEFVSETEGYLAPLDGHEGLADAIRDLYEHPKTFLAKSRAAAARVRVQTAADVVIPAEIALLTAEIAEEG